MSLGSAGYPSHCVPSDHDRCNDAHSELELLKQYLIFNSVSLQPSLGVQIQAGLKRNHSAMREEI